jgi:hypothetical protein
VINAMTLGLLDQLELLNLISLTLQIFDQRSQMVAINLNIQIDLPLWLLLMMHIVKVFQHLDLLKFDQQLKLHFI